MSGGGMTPCSDVLLLGDPSEDFARVAMFASGLVTLGMRRLVAVHVFEASGLEGPVIAARSESVREAIEESLAPVRDAGCEVAVHVGTGETQRQVLQVVEETAPGLVLAGSHGKSVGERLFAGSVSEAVASLAGAPVLVVHYDRLNECDDPVTAGASVGARVLVSTDFSQSAERAAELATSLAACAGGTLTAMAVADAQDDARERLASIVDSAAERVRVAEPVVRTGAPGEAIAAEARESGATCLVVGTHGRGALGEAFLGSVSMYLVRSAPCPVIVVP